MKNPPSLQVPEVQIRGGVSANPEGVSMADYRRLCEKAGVTPKKGLTRTQLADACAILRYRIGDTESKYVRGWNVKRPSDKQWTYYLHLCETTSTEPQPRSELDAVTISTKISVMKRRAKQMTSSGEA